MRIKHETVPEPDPRERQLGDCRKGSVVVLNNTLYLVGARSTIKDTGIIGNESGCMDGEYVYRILQNTRMIPLMSLSAGTIRFIRDDTVVLSLVKANVVVHEPLPASVLDQLRKVARKT